MELTVKVPLGVQRVVERPGREDLVSHGHLTVRVTFTWSGQREQINDLKGTRTRLREWRRFEGYELRNKGGGGKVKKNKKILLLSWTGSYTANKRDEQKVHPIQQSQDVGDPPLSKGFLRTLHQTDM